MNQHPKQEKNNMGVRHEKTRAVISIVTMAVSFLCASTASAQFAAPTLYTPSSGEYVDASSSISYSWSIEPAANAYRIRVGPNSADLLAETCATCVTEEVTSTASYTAPPNTYAPGGTLYWTVRAGNSLQGIGGYFATPWPFTPVLPPFDPPTLIAPAAGATVDPASSLTMAWVCPAGATDHRIRISPNSSDIDTTSCNSCIVNAVVHTGNYTVPANTLPPNSNLAWSVRCGNPTTSQGGYFATPRSLNTTSGSLPPFDPPTLIAPAAGVTVDPANSLNMSWACPAGATDHRIRISPNSSDIDTTSCNSCIVNAVVHTGNYTVPANTLPPNSNLAWSVRCGNPTTSQGGYFATPRSIYTVTDPGETYVCGDGVVEPPEACDTALSDAPTCADLGHAYGGDVQCAPGCLGWDDSGCCNSRAAPPTDLVSLVGKAGWEIPVDISALGTGVEANVYYYNSPSHPTHTCEYTEGHEAGFELCLKIASRKFCVDNELEIESVCSADEACLAPPNAGCDFENTSCCDTSITYTPSMRLSFEPTLEGMIPGIPVGGKLSGNIFADLAFSGGATLQSGQGCGCPDGAFDITADVSATGGGGGEIEFILFGASVSFEAEIGLCLSLGVNGQRSVCGTAPEVSPRGQIKISATLPGIDVGWFHVEPQEVVFFEHGEGGC